MVQDQEFSFCILLSCLQLAYCMLPKGCRLFCLSPSNSQFDTSISVENPGCSHCPYPTAMCRGSPVLHMPCMNPILHSHLNLISIRTEFKLRQHQHVKKPLILVKHHRLLLSPALRRRGRNTAGFPLFQFCSVHTRMKIACVTGVLVASPNWARHGTLLLQLQHNPHTSLLMPRYCFTPNDSSHSTSFKEKLSA